MQITSPILGGLDVPSPIYLLRISMHLFSKFSQGAPAAIILALSAALSACGGGGTDVPDRPPHDPIPVVKANADVYAAELNKPATLAVMSNDSVTPYGVLKLVSATTPAHGTVAISGDNLVYTPAAGFVGKDTFSYTVKDTVLGVASATAQVTVNVTAS